MTEKKRSLLKRGALALAWAVVAGGVTCSAMLGLGKFTDGDTHNLKSRFPTMSEQQIEEVYATADRDQSILTGSIAAFIAFGVSFKRRP